MTETFHNLRALAASMPNEPVEFGGHRWHVSQLGDTTTLFGFVGGAASHFTISEKCGAHSDEAPVYTAAVTAAPPFHRDLNARQGEFVSAADALTWAEQFQWSTRNVGNLTWIGAAADAMRWFTVVAGTQAEITIYTVRDGDAPYFTVTRTLLLGRQSVELKIGDKTLGDEERSILSFEQASAIALNMTDYVLELMRMASSSIDSPSSP
ncbi:hypothetical protein [Burkholderia gladioli]|uniref:hypothetical protein n=1 Tax=Burkholderia gladioli TaxID=28095 RepID=UPI003D218F5B